MTSIMAFKTGFVLFLAVVAGKAFPLTFDYRPPSRSGTECIAGSIHLIGKIEKGDTEKFLRVVQRHSSDSTEVGCNPKIFPLAFSFLWSEGGEVYEAIQLGREIRRLRLIAWARDCRGACVFLFAGGETRLADNNQLNENNLFIGQLYSNIYPLNTTLEDIRKSQEQILSMVKLYLNEMNISESLLDLMLATPPDRYRLLTNEEMAAFRLTSSDRSMSEENLVSRSKFYGVSLEKIREVEGILKRRGQECSKYRWASELCRLGLLFGYGLDEAEDRFKRSWACEPSLSVAEYESCRKKALLPWK